MKLILNNNIVCFWWAPEGIRFHLKSGQIHLFKSINRILGYPYPRDTRPHPLDEPQFKYTSDKSLIKDLEKVLGFKLP